LFSLGAMILVCVDLGDVPNGSALWKIVLSSARRQAESVQKRIECGPGSPVQKQRLKEELIAGRASLEVLNPSITD
jgi:hypothetical protein